MYSALGEPREFDIELLMRNHFCIGLKRGKKYICGGDANEIAKSKAVELLVETINRIQRWRVWETWWIDEAMDEWLEKRDRLELQLRGKYDDNVVNDLLGMVNKFISYNEQFLNHWRSVGGEVKELIDNLMSGKAEVIIWGNEKGISVYGEYVALDTHKTSTGGIIVQLVLNGLEGVTIRAPDIFMKTMSKEEYEKFINEVLRALRGGLEETDGLAEKGKVAMNTTQVWQIVVWSMFYPGEVHALVDVINVNENGVTIKWHLKSGHKSIKGKILNDIGKLSEEEILTFVFTAVLGDGWADITKVVINGRVYDETVIEITMSDKKFKRWEPLLDKLREMGFKSGKPYSEGNVIKVTFYGSNAINLARAMIAVLPPILRDVLDALAFEKWLKLRRITEMEVKWRRGEVSVNIASYRFTVNAQKHYIVLERKVKDGAEAEKVINALRARYGDGLQTRVNKSGKYLAVTIPMYAFEKYEDIKVQVIEVLCKKLERTKDEKKKQAIIKHLRRLTPNRGAAAVLDSTNLSKDEVRNS